MKLFKLLIPLLTITLLTSSCIKDYYTTEEYYTYGAQIYSYDYVIKPYMWERVEGELLPGGNNYLYAEFQNSDITPDVLNKGTVQAYVYNIYNTQTNQGAWNPLPYVYPLEVTIYEDDGSESVVIVPENIRYEWEIGKITFIIQELNGIDPEQMVSDLLVKVCVTK